MVSCFRAARTLWIIGTAALVSPLGHAVAASELLEPGDVPYATEMQQWLDTERNAPVVRGTPTATQRSALAARSAAAAAIPNGGASAAQIGAYGPTVAWPLVAIHLALLPDGRVMTYGSDTSGHQGAQLSYDIWDPSLGTDDTAHMLLPNTTQTDIFCSGMSLMWTTGQLLIAGGDQRATGRKNLSTALTATFTPATNSIAQVASMNLPRWYGTVVALPSGNLVALGGRQASKAGVDVPASTPELFNASSGWSLLPGADSLNAFYNYKNWFYPRAYVAPSGQLLVLDNHGTLNWMGVDGGGTLTPAGKLPPSFQASPTAMFAPGKILALRATNTVNAAVVIDVNGSAPVVTAIPAPSLKRFWSNATIMADGKVLVNGGSAVSNKLSGIAYQNEIWDPASLTSGQIQPWALGASAAQPRLYHSTALLLPDATVLTSGGGAPGPVTNLNAEIFYPPYLYARDGSGNAAPRPVVTLVSTGTVSAGEQIQARVASASGISRVTLLKMGAVTHAVNIDQRFMDLAFSQSQSGNTLTVSLPANTNVLMPGTYMMFSFDGSGVPSVANIITVVPPAALR